jgi:tRNA threonylcarbamoyladenosine biosynthesis protein TsaB
MRVLAIDTAGWACSVALWEDGHEIAFQETSSERNQAGLLPQLVKDVIGNSEIDQILVNIGPGSFTGIRVGLAFAKGISLGLNLPLKGIDSFTAIYQTLKPHDDVLILIESHRQDIFGQRFTHGIPNSPLSLEREDIEKILNSPHPPVVAGRGFHSFLQEIPYEEVTSPWQGAQCLAYVYFKNPSLASDASPFYVRDADVTFSKRHVSSPPHP